MTEMYDIKDVIDFYLSSKDANDTAIKYLRQCRLALLATDMINRLFDVADAELVSEARDSTYFYLKEAKDDRFYLKTIKKIMDKVALLGVDKYEKDFVSLIYLLEMKNKHMIDLETYYVEKITSQINNHGYPNPQDEDRIDEYNGKIDTLCLRLNNTIDSKE